MIKYTRYIAITTVCVAAIALIFAVINSSSAQAASMGNMKNSPHKAKKNHKLMMTGAVKNAVVVIVPTKGNKVHGVVYFKQDKDKVHVTGKITDLKPNSKHGFHIHQFGDLTSSDGSSLGGHYNPQHNEHALPHNKPRHAGDLGNIKANDKGVAKVNITVDNISVAGKLNPILGRGVVIHAKKDDGSQPTGAAGKRIGVGVIGIANNGK